MTDDSVTSRPDDAWKQLDDLMRQYTKRWEVRGLRVTAHATDRGVELEISERREDYKGPMDIRGAFRWTSTGSRGVWTMRALAGVLMAAADFVDEANPVWAAHPTTDYPVEHWEESDD